MERILIERMLNMVKQYHEGNVTHSRLTILIRVLYFVWQPVKLRTSNFTWS